RLRTDTRSRAPYRPGFARSRALPRSACCNPVRQQCRAPVTRPRRAACRHSLRSNRVGLLIGIEGLRQTAPCLGAAHIVTGLGCTESGPSAVFSNWAGGWSGLLGVPVSGLELKLVASGDKCEARYRGPNVTPGYWRQRELTEAAFDEERFYCTGDALKLVD